MRIRTPAAAATVVGALALTVLGVPSAQADGGSGDIGITKVGRRRQEGRHRHRRGEEGLRQRDGQGQLGHRGRRHRDRGPGVRHPRHERPQVLGQHLHGDGHGRPDGRPRLLDDVAGNWYVGAWVDAKDGDFVCTEKAGAFKFQRASGLSVNAAPEPVKKGKTITVTGKLARANWETIKYGGYCGQSGEAPVPARRAPSTLDHGEDRQEHLHRRPEDHRQGRRRTATTATPSPARATTPAVSAAGDYVDVSSGAETRRSPRGSSFRGVTARGRPTSTANSRTAAAATAMPTAVHGIVTPTSFRAKKSWSHGTASTIRKPSAHRRHQGDPPPGVRAGDDRQDPHRGQEQRQRRRARLRVQRARPA
ncbi:hypothetical protein SCYAM73S_01849 [Streptomyces cyaneofuscatus]